MNLRYILLAVLGGAYSSAYTMNSPEQNLTLKELLDLTQQKYQALGETYKNSDTLLQQLNASTEKNKQLQKELDAYKLLFSKLKKIQPIDSNVIRQINSSLNSLDKIGTKDMVEGKKIQKETYRLRNACVTLGNTLKNYESIIQSAVHNPPFHIYSKL